MCGGFFIDATPRWQKIGGICMLSHRPLFFPFFLLFFRQLPLDTLWKFKPFLGIQCYSDLWCLSIQNSTLTQFQIYKLPDTFCHPQLLNPAAPVHLDMLKGSPSGEQSPQRYVL